MADDAAFDQAKAFLMKADGGASLYDHIGDVLLKILEEQPTDALSNFEVLSAEVKKSKDSGSTQPSITVDPATYDRATKLGAFLQPPKPTVGEDGEVVEEESGESAAMEDVMQLADSMEKAGAGVGKEEWYRVALALTNLAGECKEKYNVDSVRFFGKIFGTQGDYLIAEGTAGEGDREPDGLAEITDSQKYDKKFVAWEEPGKGTNTNIYFACSNPGDAWVRLPDVTPEQIMASRQIKKYLTGNLDAPVLSYPVFPGTEKNYLRAQIAQIVAQTTVCPVDFFKVDDEADDEENPPLIPNEEYSEGAPTDINDLATEDAWVHLTPGLLSRQGRCTWYTPEEEEKDEEEEEEEKEEEEEPEEPEEPRAQLAALSEDTTIKNLPAWNFRIIPQRLKSSSVVSIKSVAWPGFVTVASLGGSQGVQYSSCYFGNGFSFTGKAYQPAPPPAVLEEANDEDFNEQVDPTVAEEEEFNENKEAQEEGDADGDGDEDE